MLECCRHYEFIWSACWQFLETMSDIVRQGIVKAGEDLVKEGQEKLIQEVSNSPKSNLVFEYLKL